MCNRSARKAFLIVKTFSMLIFVAWAVVFSALAYFGFAKVVVLGYSRISGEILKIFFLYDQIDDC